MIKAFARRAVTAVGSALILFLVVVTVLFALLEIAPGDPVQTLVGDVPISDEMRRQISDAYGLNQPVIQRYFTYVGNIFKGDLGYSFGTTNEQVLPLILSRAVNTLIITIPAFVISTGGSIILGSIAGQSRRRGVDGGISSLAVGLFSLPNFWLGMILIIIFSTQLGWLPTGGMNTYGRDGFNLKYALLPIITLAAAELAFKTRVMRSSVIEALGQDYIDTARSKGLSQRGILWRHAMPNALLPMVTVAGYSLGFVLVGAVLVERVFSWPGMGLLFVDAINTQNNMVTLGVTVVLTITILIVNALTDIVYGFVDPRVRSRFASSNTS